MISDKTLYLKKYFQLFSFIILFLIFTIFFYNTVGLHWADYQAHYQFAKDLHLLKEMPFSEFMSSVQYSRVISYPVWHLLINLFEPLVELACNVFRIPLQKNLLTIAIVTTLFILLTFYILVFIFQNTLKVKNQTIISYCISAAVLFVNPYYVPFINKEYYLGQFFANVWHNPTTIAVKPIGLICFILFFYLIENKNETKKIKLLLLYFSCFLVLSAFVKPTFFQIFVPAVFLYCVLEFIYTKGKSVLFNCKVGLAVFPVSIIAILQIIMLFGGEGGGIGVGVFLTWNSWSNHLLGSMLVSILFPIYVIAINYKTIFNKKYVLFSIILFMTALIQFIMFYDITDIKAGNFVWGMHLATFYLFITSIMLLWDYRKINGCNSKVRIGYALFTGHVCCGLLYFVYIYMNNGIYRPGAG